MVWGKDCQGKPVSSKNKISSPGEENLPVEAAWKYYCNGIRNHSWQLGLC